MQITALGTDKNLWQECEGKDTNSTPPPLKLSIKFECPSKIVDRILKPL